MRELRTIEDVLYELDRIIAVSVEENSRFGLFAWVYRETTDRIRLGIERGYFGDNEFMEAFDVAFARRYLDAYRNFRAGRPVTRAWQTAFTAPANQLCYMQHVLLGMNAHINLDLGIVAAELAPGERIHSIQDDFMRVNDILRQLIDSMQFRLARISRLMATIDWLGGRRDEAFIYFNIRKARNFAWRTACTLAPLTAAERKKEIEKVDTHTARIAAMIQHPPQRPLRWCLRCISVFEQQRMARIIGLLSQHKAFDGSID